MTFWQKYIKEMKPASSIIISIDLFFILLVIFMMSSNFVFLPGVKSVSLPTLPDAEIIQANKLIITISRNETADNPSGNAVPGNSSTNTAKYSYSFNGQTKNTREDLESAIQNAIAFSKTAAHNRTKSNNQNTVMLVLRAEKNLPYEELINFYSFARKLNVQLFLVTDFEKPEEPTRIRQQPL